MLQCGAPELFCFFAVFVFCLFVSTSRDLCCSPHPDHSPTHQPHSSCSSTLTPHPHPTHPLSPIFFLLFSVKLDSIAPVSSVISLCDLTAVALSAECRCISMGQGQEIHARRIMASCFQEGEWMLMQNCHLSLDYITEVMDTILDTENVKDTFRLWVTTEEHKKFSINFLQVCPSPAVSACDALTVSLGPLSCSLTVEVVRIIRSVVMLPPSLSLVPVFCSVGLFWMQKLKEAPSKASSQAR